ncbi:MAG: hypothetical protein AAFY38_12575 [Pseudomonadota bacterium]
MTFFRPEAKAALWRFREVLAGAAAALLALWWLVGAGWLLTYIGGALLLASGALVAIGLQRARFRGPGGGAGVVQVTEGQISYFGPLTGGAVAVRDLERITLDRAQVPAHWQLDQKGMPSLLIPVNAAGSEALFDAFAALPGLRTERMLGELHAGAANAVVIWERHSLRPEGARLH